MKRKILQGCYIFTLQQPCNFFSLYSSDGSCYYDRDLKEGTDKVTISIHQTDEYTANVPFEISPTENKTTGEKIELFKPERWRWKDIEVVYNPELKGTPARIFTMKDPAIIEVGDKFYSLPKQVRMFILLHEYGHLFYQTEYMVDTFALKVFLNCGFNPSQAFYALSKVLKTTPQGIDRILNIYNKLKSANYVGK